jgi:hypothetical protein
MTPSRSWLLLAIVMSGKTGLSPVQLQRSLFLVAQKREEQVGAGFYEFEEANGAAPTSPALYADIDALVATAHVVKEWMPELSASVFRLSDTGWALAEELRSKVKKDALPGPEDAVAWVKEQSYLEQMHKTSTIRVIG